jgi:hypothetical protein
MAVSAVRAAVEAIRGAGWIDVEYGGAYPQFLRPVTVYPSGKCMTPETEEWDALRNAVDAAMRAALGLKQQEAE